MNKPFYWFVFFLMSVSLFILDCSNTLGQKSCKEDTDCTAAQRCSKGFCQGTSVQKESSTSEVSWEKPPSEKLSESPVFESPQIEVGCQSGECNTPEKTNLPEKEAGSEPINPRDSGMEALPEQGNREQMTPPDKGPTQPTFRSCSGAHTINPKLSAPKILSVVEDDRLATLYWNSKTATYDAKYDPDNRAGIYSYAVEWGEVGKPFTHRALTSYRVIQLQPLMPGKTYQARVYHLDQDGRRSNPSKTVTFKHDAGRVEALRKQMNGFFVDFNEPMGPFDELEWNNAYSGCVGEGEGGQFVNPQFHAHNILASLQCDRGVTNSRVREIFDFRNRTGTIVFDVDGGVRRNIFYLDLLPHTRKRDITGHVALDSTTARADPPDLLRLVQNESNIKLQYSDSSGRVRDLPNIYRNGACGRDLRWCKGENLLTVKNIRRRFVIKISKSRYQVWINKILVVDASLINALTPRALPYEQAHVIWLHFSYNTPKANIRRALLHWDNFGFDAPAGFKKSTIVHNYMNGLVGPKKHRYGGPQTTPTKPYMTTIPIPDSLAHTDKTPALKAELMFTLQGATYSWSNKDRVEINGTSYPVPRPTSRITGFRDSNLVGAYIPHSMLMPIKVSDLKQGTNQIKFLFGPINVFNVHIELTFHHDKRPKYTQPIRIFKSLPFRPKMIPIGPGMYISEIDKEEAWTFRARGRGYIKARPVSGTVELTLTGNSANEQTSTGVVKGMVLYDLYLDRKILRTARVDRFAPVASFYYKYKLDTTKLCNGEHEIALFGYNKEGAASNYDAFQANSKTGEYHPIYVRVNNAGGQACDASNSHVSGPIPKLRTPESVRKLYGQCPAP